MRPVALSRKNSLFAGSDEGSENWACWASLIETCKLNGVNPQVDVTDLLARPVNGWPQERIDMREMDKERIPPRAAMWVHGTDTDTWKLWIVPPPALLDKHDFYRRISVIVANNRAALSGIDASDTEMILDAHPAMQGLRGLQGFVPATGFANVYFSGNTFNGFYLPDGIILRLNL